MDLAESVTKAYADRLNRKSYTALLQSFCTADRDDVLYPFVNAMVDPFIDDNAKKYLFKVIGEVLTMDEIIEEAIREGIPLADIEEATSEFTPSDLETARLIAQRRCDRRVMDELKESYGMQDPPQQFAPRPRWVHRKLHAIPSSVAKGMKKAIDDSSVDIAGFLSQVSFGNKDGEVQIDSAFVKQMIDCTKTVATVDVDAFRKLGPANGNGCTGKKAHRMFRCACLDRGFASRGKCDACGISIRYFKYAVRMPIEGGKWKGVYCSFDCLHKTPPVVMTEMDRLRIGAIEVQLNEIGIQDVEIGISAVAGPAT